MIGSKPSSAAWSAASMSARTCMAYSPGFITPRRTPRVPNMGLTSAHVLAADNSCASSSLSPTVAALISSSSTRGKNSCSGGSSSRMVTGRPLIARKMATKSCFCTSRNSSSAAVSVAGVSAKIMRRTTGKRSGAKNMCSVRHRPMPSAPNSRAAVASAAVSALARTASLPLRISSAHCKSVVNSFGGLAAASGSSPSITSPVAPSSDTQSPSRTTTSLTVNC